MLIAPVCDKLLIVFNNLFYHAVKFLFGFCFAKLHKKKVMI